jgi:hypothetical protein
LRRYSYNKQNPQVAILNLKIVTEGFGATKNGSMAAGKFMAAQHRQANMVTNSGSLIPAHYYLGCHHSIDLIVDHDSTI